MQCVCVCVCVCVRACVRVLRCVRACVCNRSTAQELILAAGLRPGVLLDPEGSDGPADPGHAFEGPGSDPGQTGPAWLVRAGSGAGDAPQRRYRCRGGPAGLRPAQPSRVTWPMWVGVGVSVCKCVYVCVRVCVCVCVCVFRCGLGGSGGSAVLTAIMFAALIG